MGRVRSKNLRKHFVFEVTLLWPRQNVSVFSAICLFSLFIFQPIESFSCEQCEESCSKLSNQFCEMIWSPPYNGNIDFSASHLLLGKSSRSEMSMAEKLDLSALLKIKNQLPRDFLKSANSLLNQLERDFKEEKDDDLWYTRIEKFNRRFAEAQLETAILRVRKRLPHFGKIAPKDRNFDENFEMKKDIYDLHGEIIRRKYETSLQWKQVVELFARVKEWVIGDVVQLNLTDSIKTRIVNKIKSVRLQFPTEDPRVMTTTEDGCGSVAVNAYYMPDRNSLTVCAGWLNTIQDDASTILVLAHEISHAFDPVTLSEDLLMETPMGKVFNKLCNGKGPAYDCQEWEKIKNEVFKKTDEISFHPLPMSTLTQCLKPPNDLKPFKSQDLVRVNEDSRRRLLHRFANKNSFSLIAQPHKFQDGQFKTNDYFLRPDRWRIPGSDQMCLSHVEMELFAQILKCQGYNESDLLNRSVQFDKSLLELEQIEFAIGQAWLNICGKDCPDLVSSKMGRVVSEEFADWIAKKSLARYLEQEQDLRKRREKLFAATSFLCERPGPFWGASDLTGIEKRWSFESHPDRKIRRLSFITPKIADLVRCKLDEETKKSNNSCELN